MPHPLLRQLYPGPPTEVAIASVYQPTGHLAAATRPYVTVNMVASVDGATAVNGVTAPLSSAGDKAIFFHLRGLADVVLVGAGTVRAEAYGSVKADEATRAARRERGQAPTAAVAIVTASLALDWSSPLFTDSTVPPFVITTVNADPAGIQAARRHATVVLAGDERVELSEAMRSLRHDHGLASVLCEGGPSLNHELLREGLVDELCLTVAPTLLGGGSKPIFGREPLPCGTALDLASVLADGGALFLRYEVRHRAAGA
jgi:riboflavin-specific deaminase-like protein